MRRTVLTIIGLLGIGCGQAEPPPAPRKPPARVRLPPPVDVSGAPAAETPESKSDPKPDPKSASGPDAGAPKKPAGKPADFADASDPVGGKWTGHGFTVRIVKAEPTTIEVGGAPKPVLALQIAILNGSTRKVDTLTWQEGGDAPAVADDQGRTCARVTVPKIEANSQIYRRPMMPLYPGKQHFDMLVLEPPGDTAQYLLLELPGANIANEGPLRFKVPRSMWAKPPGAK